MFQTLKVLDQRQSLEEKKKEKAARKSQRKSSVAPRRLPKSIAIADEASDKPTLVSRAAVSIIRRGGLLAAESRQRPHSAPLSKKQFDKNGDATQRHHDHVAEKTARLLGNTAGGREAVAAQGRARTDSAGSGGGIVGARPTSGTVTELPKRAYVEPFRGKLELYTSAMINGGKEPEHHAGMHFSPSAVKPSGRGLLTNDMLTAPSEERKVQSAWSPPLKV